MAVARFCARYVLAHSVSVETEQVSLGSLFDTIARRIIGLWSHEGLNNSKKKLHGSSIYDTYEIILRIDKDIEFCLREVKEVKEEKMDGSWI